MVLGRFAGSGGIAVRPGDRPDRTPPTENSGFGTLAVLALECAAGFSAPARSGGPSQTLFRAPPANSNTATRPGHPAGIHRRALAAGYPGSTVRSPRISIARGRSAPGQHLYKPTAPPQS